MATRNIDGSNVDRYQGRITGTFDVDDDQVRYGDVVMAVVIVDVDQLVLKGVRGNDVGTYVLKVKDFAVVDDDVMRKQLYHHLPHLQPAHDAALTAWHDGHAVERVIAGQSQFVFPAIESTTGTHDQYVELSDTVASTDDLSDNDILAHDADDGEVFNPATESRERARLAGGAGDPILKRFLAGGD